MEGALLTNQKAQAALEQQQKKGSSKPSSHASAQQPQAQAPLGLANFIAAAHHPTLTSNPPSNAGGNNSPIGKRAGGGGGSLVSAKEEESGERFLFKLADPNSEHVHRIHAHPKRLDELQRAVRGKLNLGPSAKLVLRYDDDEGDRVVIASDEELYEAVALQQRTGKTRLTLHAAIVSGRDEAVDVSDQENAGSNKNAANAASAVGAAYKIAGKVVSGANISKEEKAFGVGAVLAGLVVGVAALARR